MCCVDPIAVSALLFLTTLLLGIVPANHPIESLRNQACYVEAHTIQKFLDMIEAQEVEPISVGLVSKYIAMDQDPVKMHMGNIVDGMPREQ